MELRDLREALKITQVTLAKKLKTTQAAVSRLEKRPGMLVNTLGDYVEALGGRIEVRAVLPDRTVSLTPVFFARSRWLRAPGKRPTPGEPGRIAQLRGPEGSRPASHCLHHVRPGCDRGFVRCLSVGYVTYESLVRPRVDQQHTGGREVFGIPGHDMKAVTPVR